MNSAHAAEWEAVFQEYFKERKTNTDAIADLALENFEEVEFPPVLLAVDSCNCKFSDRILTFYTCNIPAIVDARPRVGPKVFTAEES